MSWETLECRIAALLCEPPLSLQLLGVGRNSRSFRVELNDRSLVAVKWYLQGADETSNRLAVEYAAFGLITEAGLGSVPRPLARDTAWNLGAYSWLEGRTPLPGEMCEDLLDQFLDFAAGLYRLQNESPNVFALPARGACLTPAAIWTQIDRRLLLLQTAAVSGMLEEPEGLADIGIALAQFLEGEFLPERERRAAEFSKRCRELRRDPCFPLDNSCLTLSPSDFGLHNSLVDVAGRLAFVDFEYFGQDDPAKMTADFLLHPAMHLSPVLKRHFFDVACRIFSGTGDFAQRVRLLLPAVGLKWVCILLNEFLPSGLARRRFAMSDKVGTGALARQLVKARRMLATTAHCNEELSPP